MKIYVLYDMMATHMALNSECNPEVRSLGFICQSMCDGICGYVGSAAKS